MLEEQLLAWRFNRGRTDALREIYERYKVDLVTLATTLLADKAQAEDVVHDVFAGFLQPTKKLRITGNLKSFLAVCVANRARNHNRRHRRMISDDGSCFDAMAAEEAQPDGAVALGEELRQVGEALIQLPYDQREVVLLHLKGGLKFREIAQIQAVSLNTVQGRYRYGLKKVRTLLNAKARTCRQTMTSVN
jgi:RNA polymerase sigma-70 factor (ECF subfamily)